MPKVSVLTPLYNTKPKYLKLAIESILAQTFVDFEFLLLNDSPENKELEKIVKSYNDERIKYYENEHNMGISHSRNKLIDLAQGEYLAVFDHDDMSLPQILEKEVQFLDENKDVGVVGCNYKHMSTNFKSDYPIENLDIKKAMLRGCYISHSGSMIRKSVLVENGIRYEQDYSPAEDYMLWTRLMNKTQFHNIPEILLAYRDYDNTSQSRKNLMAEKDMRIKNILFAENPSLVQFLPSVLKKKYFRQLPFYQKIFSVRNEYKDGFKRKVITVLGISLKKKVW